MNKYDIITEDLLFGLFTYEKGTGELRWRTDRRRGVKAGSLVGERNKGYRQTNILGYCYKVHKLVWFLEHGSFPSGHIDHIDGNKQNNQPENLREVTQQENNHNQRFAKGYYKTKKGNTTPK